MNERIKEIEKQCVFWNVNTEMWELDSGKFVEMIVQKCVSMVKGYEAGLGRDNQLSTAMREHFGIE